ncbi:chemotaxis response regulator protein-glutamate methylesterase [Novosphingobium flavum]|uniref:protein-glutamate methylesterase/protein-glutamine glutaminase n=1 Tax=Novosphingobium aerophilum TaxID=2839843 RepID=UPI00163B0AC9|nr:chemotaxis response regulator protein-glutamate methylesterase [Novosphingobium aerophilum]MBC2661103.1 chemotaxis response regulator protein-glutamate methylesterase [Novosphingobium aerophilum]
MTIRVVVVEDSPTMRAILMARLSEEPDIKVVATAANAAEGRELIRQFDPDVVTLDIEMPGMNGLDFLDKIMALRPTPVIIISGATQEGAATTAEALARGAVACYAKAQDGSAFKDGRLADMIREAAQVRFQRPAVAQRPVAPPPPPVSNITTMPRRSGPPSLVAIGSSTGGVEALHAVLSAFPADCPPTVIVQHVNARFAPSIAQSLDQACPPRVLIAEPDMPLRPGHVYLAPGDDRHLTVSGTSSGYHARLRPGQPISGHMPSVDALFLSVAEKVGAAAAGILLTGMGSDGAQGLLAMHRAGALTIAQDEATCTVFGMPRAAIALGAAGVVAPLNSIPAQIFRMAA